MPPTAGLLADFDKSHKRQLMSDEDLRRHTAALHQHLATDTSEEVKAGLRSPMALEALGHLWFQRMAIPGTACFTTSAPSARPHRKGKRP
jgi:hypothetical protein